MAGEWHRTRGHGWIFSGLLPLSGAAFAAQLIPLAVTPLLTRMYSASDFGRYALFAAMLNVTGQLACLKYDLAIVVVREEREARSLFFLSVRIAAALAVVLTLLMPLGNRIAERMGASVAYWLPLTPLGTLLLGTHAALSGIALRGGQLRIMGGSAVVRCMGTAAAQVLLAKFLPLGLGLPVAYLLGYAAGIAVLAIGRGSALRRTLPSIREIRAAAWRQWTYPSCVTAGAFANSMAYSVSSFAVASLFSGTALGCYSLADRLIAAPLTVISGPLNRLFTQKLARRGEGARVALFLEVSGWMAVAALGLSVGGFFAAPLLPFLLGAKWEPVIPLFRAMLPLFAIRFAVSPVSTAAIVAGRSRSTMIWQFWMLAGSVGTAYAARRFSWSLLGYLWTFAAVMGIGYLIFYLYCLFALACRMPSADVWASRVLAFALPASVLLLSYELAAGSSFYMLELSLLLLGASLAIGMTRRFRGDRMGWIRCLLLIGQPHGWVVRVPLLYLLIDVLNAFYSPVPAAIYAKYRLVAVLVVVAAAICYVREIPGALRGVRLAVAFSSTVICAITLVNYFVFPIYPIFYTARISLRADYNMYATAVFTGMVAGFFESLSRPSRRARTVGILFFLLPALSVISLSASRRLYIVLGPTLAGMLAVWLVTEWRASAGIGIAWTLAASIGGACLVGVGTLLLSAGMRRILPERMAPFDPSTGAGAETSVSERYKTVGEGSLLAKRRVIWSIGLRELSTYRGREWIVGKGNGANILLYDTIGAELDGIYPDRGRRMGALSAHNMLLADALDGGMLKLLAGGAMVVAIGWASAKAAWENPKQGLPIGIILALCVANSMISNRFGLLYDRFFYIYIALLATQNRREGMHDLQEGCDADHRAPS